MNSPHSPLRLLQEREESIETRADEQVEDYLDYLCAPLIGSMPYRERRRFRMEALAHIDGLIAEYREQGFALPEAVQKALREFGEPGQIGQVFSWKGDHCFNTSACRSSASWINSSSDRFSNCSAGVRGRWSNCSQR